MNAIPAGQGARASVKFSGLKMSALILCVCAVLLLILILSHADALMPITVLAGAIVFTFVFYNDKLGRAQFDAFGTMGWAEESRARSTKDISIAAAKGFHDPAQKTADLLLATDAKVVTAAVVETYAHPRPVTPEERAESIAQLVATSVKAQDSTRAYYKKQQAEYLALIEGELAATILVKTGFAPASLPDWTAPSGACDPKVWDCTKGLVLMKAKPAPVQGSSL